MLMGTAAHSTGIFCSAHVQSCCGNDCECAPFAGKEYEMKHSKAFPGQLSPELKQALGMSELSPPPWLINMQRYGPPPSYPSLKVPGLNASIPPGSEFGYQPGGWGKPPVDESGQPLYGDVFGVNAEPDDDLAAEVTAPLFLRAVLTEITIRALMPGLFIG